MDGIDVLTAEAERALARVNALVTRAVSLAEFRRGEPGRGKRSALVDLDNALGIAVSELSALAVDRDGIAREFEATRLRLAVDA